MSCECDFSENLDVGGDRRALQPDYAAKKSAEMNVSDIELFKKSKIIEIGSVRKKLRYREVGDFLEKIGNPGIFVPEI